MYEFGAMRSRVAIMGFVGTAFVFYDFYIYCTAAAIAFGPIFSPSTAEATRWLALAGFAIALVARLIGAVIFGYFGDRKGRKPALVVSLLLTGACTTLIGILPGYRDVGILSPIALCVLHFGQGIGFGGGWAGAVLLAVETSPVGLRTRFAMFPQLGAPVGFIAANATLLVLAEVLGSDQFLDWGWRLPFLFGVVLVIVGLYVRLKLDDTPVFQAMLAREKPARMPVGELFDRHGRRTILGAVAIAACYTLFYLSTVLSLSYGTSVLRMPRAGFLSLEWKAVVAMAIAMIISAWLADRYGPRRILMAGLALTALSGALFDRMLGSGSASTVMLFLFIELLLMGMIFAPMGAFLPGLFPGRVRYMGAAISYNLGGVLGTSFAPSIAQQLADRGGLPWVGAYLAAMCLISFLAVWMLGETSTADLADQLSGSLPDSSPATVKAETGDQAQSASQSGCPPCVRTALGQSLSGVSSGPT
jgi:MFS family permease